MDMSFDEIQHLDWNPDPGVGLRDRAREVWEEKRRHTEEEKAAQCADLLSHAMRRVHEVLDIVNAGNCRVEPKHKDGDGEVFFEADGMEFKVSVLYPSGGAEEPTNVTLSVKCRSGFSVVSNLETLGRLIEDGNVRFIEREDEECATD